MIAVCLREGWSIGWVPIRTIYGDETSHIQPGQHLREFLAMTSRARRIARPRRGPEARGLTRDQRMTPKASMSTLATGCPPRPP